MKQLEDYDHTQADRCNMCGADIVWVRTGASTFIPVDPAPVPGGELSIIAGIVQPPLGDLLDLIHGPDNRYTQHVRTCSELQGEEIIQQRIEEAMSKAPHPHEVKNCNCGESVFLAPSAASQKKIPLHSVADPTGNVFLNDKHEAVYVSAKNTPPQGATLYRNHIGSCPHSDQYRSPK